MRYKSKKNMLYIIFLTFGITGIIFGTLFANIYGNQPQLISFLENFNIQINSELLNKRFDIINTFFSYGCAIFIIWFFGYTSFAVYINLITVTLYGCIYGYIMSNFFIEYSFKGIIFFVILYLIQSLIFITVLFRISYVSIIHSVSRHNCFSIFRETKKYIPSNKYMIELLLSAILVCLISLIDTYIISLINNFL